MSDTIGLQVYDDHKYINNNNNICLNDTMECKFRLDDEDKMTYTKIYEFEIEITVKQYWNLFCENGCPYGINDYLIADYNSDINVSNWELTAYNNEHDNIHHHNWYKRTVNWCARIEIPQWVTHIISTNITNINMERIDYKCELVDDFYIIHTIVRLKNGPFHQTFKIYQKRIMRQRVKNDKILVTNIQTYYVAEWLKFNLFASHIENKARTDIHSDCMNYRNYIIDRLAQRLNTNF
eukprot:495448_1